MNSSENKNTGFNIAGVVLSLSIVFVCTALLSQPYLNELALKSHITTANQVNLVFQSLIRSHHTEAENTDKLLVGIFQKQVPDLNSFAAISGMNYILSSNPVHYPAKLNSQDLNDKEMYDLFRKVKFGHKTDGDSYVYIDIVKNKLRQPVRMVWAAPVISNGQVSGVLKQVYTITHDLPQRMFFIICLIAGILLLIFILFFHVSDQNIICYTILVLIGLLPFFFLSSNRFHLQPEKIPSITELNGQIQQHFPIDERLNIDIGATSESQTGRVIFETELPFTAKCLPMTLMLTVFWLFNSGRVYRWMQVIRGNYIAYLYVAPAMAGMLLLVAIPLVYGVILAFMQVKQDKWEFVGVDNFIAILSDFHITDPSNFYYTLAVTVLWTAVNVFLHVGIGLSLALLLNRPTLKFKKLYRVLLILPWAIPNYITALIWKGMFHKQFGAINAVLAVFGIEPISWFNSFWTAFFANIATNVWLGFPFMMVISLGALQSIPGELYEAAAIDGAAPLQRFKTITLPLLKSALFPAIILGTIWTFNMFNIIYLVSGGAPEGATDILIVDAYRWAFQKYNYGYAAAYSMVIFAVLFTYSVLTNRMTKATEGAFD